MTILQDIQSNIRYRVQSARAMLMGGSKMESASPIERRKEIMERRREALVGSSVDLSAGLFSSNRGDDGSTVENVDVTRRASDREGAQRLNEERERQQQTRESQRHVRSGATRMSRVDRGTARNPSERSFN